MNKVLLILLSGLIAIVTSYFFISAIYIFIYGAIQISGISNSYHGDIMNVFSGLILIILWVIFYKILYNRTRKDKST